MVSRLRSQDGNRPEISTCDSCSVSTSNVQIGSQADLAALSGPWVLVKLVELHIAPISYRGDPGPSSLKAVILHVRENALSQPFPGS